MSRHPVQCFLALFFLVTLPLQGWGQQDKQSDELVRKIVAAWRGRQARVQTLTCTAKVDSFYPKGYVTKTLSSNDIIPGKPLPICPEEDSWFTGEPISWDFDFVNRRMRIEQDLTKSFVHGPNDYELRRSYNVFLAADGTSKICRPRDRYPQKSLEAGVLCPDVNLYQNASNAFVIGFRDIPLLWVAGGVTGQWPNSADLTYLEDASGFTYRGETQWQGRDCVILTAKEQRSPTGVREFWVGRNSPYPIYVCRVRDGEKLYWQMEITYRDEEHDPPLPSQWVNTNYSAGNPGVFTTQTIRVEQLQLNESIPAARFEYPLEPGMMVFDVGKNKPFEVLEDGSLGTLGSYTPKTGSGRFWLWFGVGVAILLAGLLGWRHLHRRNKQVAL